MGQVSFPEHVNVVQVSNYSASEQQSQCVSGMVEYSTCLNPATSQTFSNSQHLTRLSEASRKAPRFHDFQVGRPPAI